MFRLVYFCRLISKIVIFMLAQQQKKIDYCRKLGTKIGDNCSILGGYPFGSEPWLIAIGDDVRITSGVSFVTHDGSVHVLRKIYNKPFDKFGAIKVGNNVFIGIQSIIMPGVKIGNNVIIGSGSIVTNDIPDNSVAAGVPAKVIGSIDEYYEKNKHLLVLTKGMNEDEKRKYTTELFNRAGNDENSLNT